MSREKMSANGWRILLIVFMQSLIISSVKAGYGQAGSCFSSSFSRAIGYILRGFLLGEMKVSTVMECKKRCIIGANCLSLNILTNADGSFLCQLNSERKENGLKEQFVPHGAGEYYGLKEKKLCENNGKSCDSATPWHAFNQSYFKLVDLSINWHDALKFCRAENSDLASISSEEEQVYLYKTFVENTGVHKWIGLNDIEEEDVFVWTDESSVSHIRFDTDEPDNVNGQHCVVLSTLNNGGLKDKSCASTFPFICETNYSSVFA